MIDMNRREFIKFLGLATAAVSLPIPTVVKTIQPADAITRRLLTDYTYDHIRPQVDMRKIYDFRIDCDDTNNHPMHIDEKLILDIYVKPISRSLNVTRNRVTVNYGFPMDEHYLNRERYDLLDLVGPKALALIEQFSRGVV